MSKQEKLAALIEAARTYSEPFGPIREALKKYDATPDDPPKPPEMPECVRELLKTFVPVCGPIAKAVAAVEAYYAKPLKLEVGKCYEDAGGNVVSIVWQDPKNPNHFIGVSRLEGVPWWYLKNGTAKSDHLRYAGAVLIREVNP